MTLVDQPVEQPIRTTGNNLVGLWRPAFIKVKHRLFVFGGGGNTSSELHTLDLCDMQWRTIHVIICNHQTNKGAIMTQSCTHTHVPGCPRYQAM